MTKLVPSMSKTSKHRSKSSFVVNKWLAFAFTIALSTFLVLGTHTALATLLSQHNDLVQMSAFERGQYYFNADENPEGPYDLVKARQAYNAALMASTTENVLAWYQLGRVDFIEGKFDAALYKFDKQLEYFGETVPNVYYMIGLTYGFKARQTGDPLDWQKGAEAFEHYITFEPTVPWPRVDLAWIYFSQGNFSAMLPTLEQGLKHHPENPWLLNMYGLALLNTGKKDEALVQFELANAQVAGLTEAEWGRSYPGNSPTEWGEGLASFRDVVQKNIELAKSE